MKRLILIAIALLMLAAPIAQAVDVVSDGGIVLLARKGDPTQLGYYVGAESPILTALGKGVILRGNVDFMFTDLAEEEEVTFVRTVAFVEKSILSEWHVETVGLDIDGEPITKEVIDWRWFAGFGAGNYALFHEGPTENYRMYGFQMGFEYNKFSIAALIEDIKIPGPNWTLFGFTASMRF